jgi:glycosyltransferase involved in cell wall biosynthesis
MTGPWPHPVETILLTECGYWRFLRRLVRASKDSDVMILRGTSGFTEYYAEAVAALLIKLVRRRRAPVIFVNDASWDLSSQAIEKLLPRWARPLLPKLGRIAVRIPDGPHVVYGVLSTDEVRSFEERWGIETDRVRFTPYYATVDETLAVGGTTDGGYVFAGGNTNRDYELLVEAAEGLDFPVRIASTWTPCRPLPTNVEITYTSVEEYHRRMAAATAIVVPLEPSARSVGQQTYLSAMLLGKPTIITEAPGVRDYVRAGENALVVDRDADALRQTLRWVLDSGNREEVDRLTAAGRSVVEEQYMAANYYRAMWEEAVAFWQQRRGAR